ncbi:MAG: TolC family protein [Pseudomonadota bacterium]
MPVPAQAATISDSVTQALSSHPKIKAGTASLAAADRNVWEQRSAFFPVLQVNGSAGRLYTNDKTTRALTTSQGGAASWMGQGTVTLTQPVFAGFGIENRFQGAEDRFSAASYDLSGTGEEIALSAARAHLNLMRTRELLTLAGGYLSDIEGRRKNIALMVKGGAADEAELLQADEAQAMAKNMKLGYEEAYRQAEADYIEVAGAGPDAVLEIGEKKWNAVIPATIEDAVAYAARENPQVLAAESLVSALTREASAEKAGLLPRLDAEMSYSDQDQADVVGGETSSVQGMLRLGWSFSTGGAQLARIEKAGQQKIEADARRQDVAGKVKHDVQQKYTSMQIVDQQFALLAERENASRKILENFLVQFEGGKQSNLQLIAAHSKVFEAGTSRTDAYYRKLLSRFELLNAMGRLRGVFEAAETGAKQKG